jgi:hypothetical protein
MANQRDYELVAAFGTGAAVDDEFTQSFQLLERALDFSFAYESFPGDCGNRWPGINTRPVRMVRDGK